MINVVPVGGANAIEAAAFVLLLSRELTQSEAQGLTQLQGALADDLPFFQTTSGLQIHVEGDQVKTSPTLNLGGVLLQRFARDGKPEWTLKAQGNSIVVNCLRYERWNTVWPSACKFIRATVAHLGRPSDGLGVQAFIHQVVDRFQHLEGVPKYQLHDVFRKDCVYLTPWVRQVGHLWHVHQGWFDDSGDSAVRWLNTLNLGTSLNPGMLTTNIDHTVQCQYTKPVTLDLKSGVDLDKVFVRLHERNKDVMKKLLTDNMLAKINLS